MIEAMGFLLGGVSGPAWALPPRESQGIPSGDRVPIVTLRRKGNPVKKFLLLLIVVALGAAVAYKVRGDA
jgi:hypothetical protein